MLKVWGEKVLGKIMIISFDGGNIYGYRAFDGVSCMIKP